MRTLHGIPSPAQQPHAIRFLLLHDSDRSVVLAFAPGWRIVGTYEAGPEIAQAMFNHYTRRHHA
jgi:hypothetical protein